MNARCFNWKRIVSVNLHFHIRQDALSFEHPVNSALTASQLGRSPWSPPLSAGLRPQPTIRRIHAFDGSSNPRVTSSRAPIADLQNVFLSFQREHSSYKRRRKKVKKYTIVHTDTNVTKCRCRPVIMAQISVGEQLQDSWTTVLRVDHCI